MRRALLAALGLLSALLVPAAGGPVPPAALRPNVVLILGDDIGYSDYGSYGGEIRTPNLDRLALEGMRFTRFYNNSVCVPTRASLLTGLYPRYVGRDARIQLTERMVTLGELLQDAGYQTALSGKWHLGREEPHRPRDRGFQEYFGLLDGCSNCFNPNRPDPPFEGGRVRHWSRNEQRITEFPRDFYATDAITDHAVAQIRRMAASGKPFFSHVCYTAAHSPLHARPRDIARYRGRYRAGWDTLRAERHARQRALGIVEPGWRLPAREPEVLPWDEEPLTEWQQSLMETYAAMVDSMDQGIGRILAALREAGVERETAVFVLNDNGGCAEQAGGHDPKNLPGPEEHYVSCGAGWAWLQNTPFRRYKGWAHEGGIATPLVARWPGVVPEGAVTGQVGHLVDFLPTLAEMAGVLVPAERRGRRLLPVEGISLLPALRGERSEQPRELYWAQLGSRGCRQGDWKLVWDQYVQRWELYDMAEDRTETRDRSGAEPARVSRMAAAWEAWARRTGAIQRDGDRYHLIRVPEVPLSAWRRREAP